MSETAENGIKATVKAFLQDLEIGHSPATVKTYRVALSRFCQYLGSAELADPAQTLSSQLKTDWAVNFLRSLATTSQSDDQDNKSKTSTTYLTTKVSKATLATYSAALLRYYNWCGTEQHLSLSAEEYARLNKRLKELRGKQQRTILNKVPADEVLDKLLEQVRLQKPEISSGPHQTYDRSRHSLMRLRNVALLETLKCSGARVSEICGLTRGELDNLNRRARVVGKGSKERWIYFSPVAWQALEEYLTVRSSELKKLTDEGEAEGKVGRGRRERASELEQQPLFCRHDRGAGKRQLKPLAPRSIENMLWQLVEEAELQVYITPHKFRHWFATRVLAATGDLATTQDLLGHASPATTRIYAQVSEQRKQSAHREVFGS